MTQGGDTIFGKIIRREIPAQIVYETDNVLAFRDISPQAPVHILVIPKKPIPNISALSPEDGALIGEVLLAAAEIAHKEGLAEGGYRLVTNIGHDGGQTVAHLHFHLLGGRPMLWPPG
jgi:histidine triad (HIT) family protein